MPYDILAKAGLPTGILIIMAFLIHEWVKSNKAIHLDYKNFVNDVTEKSDKREDILMGHIKKQDDNMDKIVNTLDKMDLRIGNIEKKM